MRKILLLVSLVFGLTFFTKAQLWRGFGTPNFFISDIIQLSDSELIVFTLGGGGAFDGNFSNTKQIWKNDSIYYFPKIDSIVLTSANQTRAYGSYKNELYFDAHGYLPDTVINAVYKFNLQDSVLHVSLKIGDKFGNLILNEFGYINYFREVADTLYAFGNFYFKDTITEVVSQTALLRLVNGQWEIPNWYNIQKSTTGANGIVEFKGEKYLYGSFNHCLDTSLGWVAGNVLYNIMHITPTGLDSVQGWKDVMYCWHAKVYQNELYISGLFNRYQGAVGNGIARWDGTQWKDVGGGVNLPWDGYSAVNRMEVYNGLLYCAGGFESAGGQRAKGFATWDGAQWCVPDTSLIGNRRFLTMLKFNNRLFLGGGGIVPNNGDTVRYLAEWLGSPNDTLYCGVYTGWDSILGPLNVSEPLIKSGNWQVYPNPAEEVIYLQCSYNFPFGTHEYSIFDIQGKQHKTGSVTVPFSEHPISINDLPTGTYILRFNDRKLGSMKFIKIE